MRPRSTKLSTISVPCCSTSPSHFWLTDPSSRNVRSARSLTDERYSHSEANMDKDRIEGSANQAKGSIKEMAGKVTGDAKLEAEGKADKAAGKVQNAIGGLKDTLRGK